MLLLPWFTQMKSFKLRSTFKTKTCDQPRTIKIAWLIILFIHLLAIATWGKTNHRKQISTEKIIVSLIKSTQLENKTAIKNIESKKNREKNAVKVKNQRNKTIHSQNQSQKKSKKQSQ